MRTRALVEAEIAVARVSGRRASRAAGLFALWLLVTWLGPELSPRGWSLWASALAVVLYSVLTVTSLLGVWSSAIRVLRHGLRRVVSAHLAPFWVLLSGCACAGAAVWSAVDDPVASVWLGLGAALTLLTAGHAIARFFEIRALEGVLSTLRHAPADAAFPTWDRDLRSRLASARSIRL